MGLSRLNCWVTGLQISGTRIAALSVNGSGMLCPPITTTSPLGSTTLLAKARS